MTPTKVKAVFQIYLARLDTQYPNVEPQQMTPNAQMHEVSRGLTYETEIAHLKYVCIQGQKFLDEGHAEKSMRWLGFIQGVLWARGMYTLDDLKNHNRPRYDLEP